MEYVLYYCDSETCGVDAAIHDVIEVSFIRSTDGVQKTWKLRPLTPETIDLGALRVNGHKLEDLKLETKYGRETYIDPVKAIVEIENWIAEDNCAAENRVLCGHNINFDSNMLKALWKKCNSTDTYPFGRRSMDTMMVEFFLDYCKESFADSYSLSALVKKYGVVNSKAHSADADTKATKDVFLKQVDFFKKILNKNA